MLAGWAPGHLRDRAEKLAGWTHLEIHSPCPGNALPTLRRHALVGPGRGPLGAEGPDTYGRGHWGEVTGLMQPEPWAQARFALAWGPE